MKTPQSHPRAHLAGFARLAHSAMLRTSIAVIAAACVIALVASGVMAATRHHETPEQALANVSHEAAAAMRDVRAARVAIFEGQPKDARRFIESARDNLTRVEKDAPSIKTTIRTQEKVGDKTLATDKLVETSDLVPIDAALGVSEDFVATPEKASSIKKANQHLKKGDTKRALETLREADIAVSITREYMPLSATVKDVDRALALFVKDEYYQANLALKAAEDGLVLDSTMLYQPEQPAHASRGANTHPKG